MCHPGRHTAQKGPVPPGPHTPPGEVSNGVVLDEPTHMEGSGHDQNRALLLLTRHTPATSLTVASVVPRLLHVITAGSQTVQTPGSSRYMPARHSHWVSDTAPGAAVVAPPKHAVQLVGEVPPVDARYRPMGQGVQAAA